MLVLKDALAHRGYRECHWHSAADKLIKEIELWLQKKGLSFRSPYEDARAALTRFEKVLKKRRE